MSERKYANLSAVQLDSTAKEHWSDLVQLREILNELRRRTSKRAVAIRADVETRVASLEGNTASGKRPGHDNIEIDRLKSEISKLTNALLAASRKNAELDAEIDRLRKSNSQSGPNSALYASVGAVESIEDFALKALRTAFRKEYHPDRKDEAKKKAAEEKFKAYEAVFDRIDLLRRR